VRDGPDPRGGDAEDDPHQRRTKPAAHEEQEHRQGEQHQTTVSALDEQHGPDPERERDDHGQHAGDEQVRDHRHGWLPAQDLEGLRARP
jgi:hypothetical protein